MFKILRGNPGKRALPQNEPEIPEMKTPPPAFLTNEARNEWTRLGQKVGKTGMLTEADWGPLVVYCSAFGYFSVAAASVAQIGLLVKSPSGMPVKNPMLRIAKEWALVIAKLAPEFGLTPSSRSRVAVKRKEAPSKLSRFVKIAGGGRGA